MLFIHLKRPIKGLAVMLVALFGYSLINFSPATNLVNRQKIFASTRQTATPANQASLTKGNVVDAWQQGFQGQGMVVAVVDSGIQPHHDLTLSDPATAKITKIAAKQFIANRGYGRYVSAKIPFAYDYVNNNNDDTAPDEQASFHGQHVAGIVAANGSPTKSNSRYVKGVAPQAQLLNMKVFGGFDDEFPSDVARAIRDAVDLGANVINLSLGIVIGNQSQTDQEQATIHYAVNHGVFVAVAGSNYGHAGSILTDNNEDANSNQTTYEPANTGTITNPAVSAEAVAVGDENTSLGAKSAMDPISSWGPTPQFDFKPEISAPGKNIVSTWKNNTLTTDTGTSMASPYIAGSAALVMQKLTQTQPDLQGKALVDAVKVSLMNAAQPMNDRHYPGNLVSPRQQGAGQVNVENAVNLAGSAIDTASGQSAVSLHQIGNQAHFTVRVTNHGSTPQTYTINPGTPATETRTLKSSGVGIAHDFPLVGATLTSSINTVELRPQQSKTIDFNLNIATLTPSNKQVEGYVTFKAADDSQNLTVPYYGYYGDSTVEQVIDKPANQSGSIFLGGYLLDNHNTPLGLGDRTSLASYINDHPKVADQIPTKIVTQKVAFSPNGDGHADSVNPYVFAKQNLAAVKVQILDATGHVIRTVDQETNTTRSFHEDGAAYNNDLTLSDSLRLDPQKFTWDGKVFNQTTGKMTPVVDGRYTYQFKTTNFNAGRHRVQFFDLPVKVDMIAPKILKTSYHNGVVSAAYTDSGAGFGPYSALRLSINHASPVGVGLNNHGKSNRGTIRFRLPPKQRQQLTKKGGQLQLTLSDVADNTNKRTIRVKPSVSQSKARGPFSNQLWDQQTSDLPVMQSREPYALTARFMKTPGIHFHGLNDNNISIINAHSHVYNATSHILTITGQVKRAHSKLIILKNPAEVSSQNRVHLTKTGHFQFKIPLQSPSQRGIGYILTHTTKKKTHSYRGTLEMIVDTTLPTLTIGQDRQAILDHQTGHYDVTTSSRQFTLSGTVDDNIDGCRPDINGNLLFHEHNDAGFNPLPSQKISNPHNAHHFNQTFNLHLGTNYFTVTATDQTGNQVTKVFRVYRTN